MYIFLLAQCRILSSLGESNQLSSGFCNPQIPVEISVGSAINHKRFGQCILKNRDVKSNFHHPKWQGKLNDSMIARELFDMKKTRTRQKLEFIETF